VTLSAHDLRRCHEQRYQPATRAVLVEAFGEPSSFRLVKRDPGAPGPGEVRLRIHASSISLVDVLVTEGGYQIKPDLPFVPGSDVGLPAMIGPVHK
jgi:NADPH:quinone reductase-like Zn-dependent oxidoreductase